MDKGESVGGRHEVGDLDLKALKQAGLWTKRSRWVGVTRWEA